MSRPNFEDEIVARINAIRARNAVVMRESVQRVIEIAQTPVAAGGNLPVDSGFLRSSLQVTSAENPSPPRDRPSSDARRYSYDGSGAALAILGWDFKRPLRATYTANYARHVHWGANGRPGRPWVTLAAQRFPQIVAAVVAETKALSK